MCIFLTYEHEGCMDIVRRCCVTLKTSYVIFNVVDRNLPVLIDLVPDDCRPFGQFPRRSLGPEHSYLPGCGQYLQLSL